MPRSNRRRICLVWVIVLAALPVGGCGSTNPFDLVEISGKVSYEDGSLIPAERISVTFLPQTAPIDPKTHPRPGAAEVDVTTGQFSLATTHDYADGIVVGRHRVLVTAFDDENLPTDAIPSQYSDAEQSPLFVDTADAPFHLKVE